MEEAAYVSERKAVKIGQVETISIDETFAEDKLAAALFNGKKLVYGIDADGIL